MITNDSNLSSLEFIIFIVIWLKNKFPHSFLKIYIDAFVFMKIIKVNCWQESMINYSEKAKINYIDEYTYKKKS